MAKSALIVTHHIFLTKEQRYAIQSANASVIVTGVSSPIWVNDGKWESDVAHEVFCKYQLINSSEPDQNTVRVVSNGYAMIFTGTMVKNLKDHKDEGGECLMFTHRNVLNHNGQQVPVVHCVEIEDIYQCIKTLA
jgi:hypothetical protein